MLMFRHSLDNISGELQASFVCLNTPSGFSRRVLINFGNGYLRFEDLPSIRNEISKIHESV